MQIYIHSVRFDAEKKLINFINKKMEKLIELVTNIRNLRSSINLSPKEEILVEVFSGDQSLLEYFKLNNSSLYNLSL